MTLPTIKEALKTLEIYEEGKFYAVFNKHSFYIYSEEKLKCLVKKEHNKCEMKDVPDNDIQITISDILSSLTNKGSHFVIKTDCLDDIFDFYNSNQWKKFE
jgi:hypothetical protein